MTEASSMIRPHTTLQPFSRFAGQSGPAKMTIASDAFAQQLDSRRFPPAYQSVLNAIRLGHLWGDFPRRMDDAVRRARPGFGSKFREAGIGWADHIAAEPITDLALAPSATWTAAGLDVNVNPNLIIRRATGAVEVMRVWLTDKPPTDLTIEATLGLMALCMEGLCPGATPVLLDVRRGLAHRNRRYRDAQVTRWLSGEAAAFVSVWSAAA